MSEELGAQRDSRPNDRPWQDLESKLTVDEARDKILSGVTALSPFGVPLLDSLGHVLAAHVTSTESVPPFDNSAMDGFAVRAADTGGATRSAPVRLRVVGERAPGIGPTFTVGQGEAVRIMTGAPVPPGADAIVRFEETDEFDSGPRRPDKRPMIEIYREATRGQNIRLAGEDIRAGDVVLPAGTVIGPAEIGALAATNHMNVQVVRRPIVGILSTGDEVVDDGAPLEAGQIRNSNSYMIAAQVIQFGGVPRLLGVAGDAIHDVRARLRQLDGIDVLVTSGGVSVGDYDVVKHALQAEGEIELWQVRIKPGKPMAFGRVGGIPLLGLPGNPVAAFVGLLEFGEPVMRRMRGLTASPRPCLRARLLAEHENRGRRRHYVRGVYSESGGERRVRPVDIQGSGVLSSLTRANCLFVIPEEWDYAPEGADVDVIPIRDIEFLD